MKRLFFMVALAGWLAIGVGSALQAQTKVMYKDASKKDTRQEVNGVVVGETPSAVQVKPNFGGVRTFPVEDILDVQYDVKDLKTDWNKAWNAEWITAPKYALESKERRAELTNALSGYLKLQPKVAGSKDAERHLQYKVAILTATLAEGDKTQMKTAADLLDKFYKAYPTSWQIVPVINRQSELYLALGDFEKASGAFDALKKVPGVSPETKADCDLKSADLLIKAKKHVEASARLTAIITPMKPTNPLYEPLRMKLILCKANTPDKFKEAIGELKKMKESTKDHAKLALVYNTLGDCYLMNNQPKDAVFEYLYVDQIYNSDKAEHVRAVTQLVQVFKELREPDRSKEYAQKLDKLKTQ